MLGGYLEFFMKPALAETYLILKRELDELIHKKVSHCLGTREIEILQFLLCIPFLHAIND